MKGEVLDGELAVGAAQEREESVNHLLPTAPSCAAGADVLETGAQVWGSEGAEGIHVDYAPPMGRGSGILTRPRDAAATPRSPRR